MPSLVEKREAEYNILDNLVVLDEDPDPTIKGVLLSDQISFYADKHKLIHPFDKANLKPAGYELTVGDEYFRGGEYHSLEKENGKIVIPPFEVAVIKTRERVCLPRFMIARWNIKVSQAYNGLLWVGGPQVDPGYKGFLFCPLYNLSDQTVILSHGEAIALIDFTKTTDFNKGQSIAYRSRPTRPIIEDFGIDDFKSALHTKAAQKIDEFDGKVRALEQRFVTFTQISIAVFALMFGLLGTITKVNSDAHGAEAGVALSLWGAATTAISAWALLLAIFSYFNTKISEAFFERNSYSIVSQAQSLVDFLRYAWKRGVVASLVACILFGLTIYFFSKPYYDQLGHGVALQEQVDKVQQTQASDLQALAQRVNALESQLSQTKVQVKQP